MFFPAKNMIKEIRKICDTYEDIRSKIRVISFVKNWIEINQDILLIRENWLALEEFVESFDDDPHLSSVSQMLRSKMDDKILGETEEIYFDHSEVPKPIISKKAKISLFQINPMELARQFTLIDQKYMRKINLKDFYNLDWETKKRGSIAKFRKRTDDLAYWIAWNILREEKIKKRVRALGSILNLAKV